MILSQYESDRWREVNWKHIKTHNFDYIVRPHYITRVFIMERGNKQILHFIPKDIKRDTELLALTT